MISKLTEKSRLFLTSSAALALATSMMYAPMAGAIVPNDNNTPDDAVDTEGGVNGVGQMFTSDFGVCTGTLINPRTVIFAAHCVNGRAESEWGTTSQISFSFNVDNLPAIQSWFFGGFQTNTDLNIFNVNQVHWNPLSAATGFLEADVALASLDTPASEIPTWALLFSALPAPDALDPVTGTGYHVNLTGYGRSGSGTAGDFQGIDFRRRAAENYLGSLASLDDRNTFLFGGPAGLPQDLYSTDFDDPNQTNPFDFNLFLDEALPNEGTTAGGDSGGPLILDAANNDITDIDIVLGVLSGGSRFFGPQVFSSYGTQSFYQPLFLFYEYIAANNPYRYVSAQAGDGNWEDASHWVTDLDPAYYILNANNELVNGFPDEEQIGVGDSGADFGGICFDRHGEQIGDFGCVDLNDGTFIPPTRNDPEPEEMLEATGTVGNARGQVTAEDLSGGALAGVEGVLLGGESQSQNIAVDFAEEAPQSDVNLNLGVDFVEDEAQAPGDPLPAPTIDNGLAGATDFVPNNIEPDPIAGVDARYFDVTLSADGTTTLSSTVTIDRLTINGAGAGLDIGSAGNLTSLIDIEQIAGTVNVDGRLTSVGDYLLMSGMLTGSGTITTPFLTNVMGGIAPGGNGNIDRLVIDGSAVLASASGLMIDIGANRVSDNLAITGDSSLGGQVIFIPTADVQAGNTYNFLTTVGTQTGEFTTSAISAILTPVLSYTENGVVATIEAGSYDNAIDTTNAVQGSYAKMLDGGRGASELSAIFASLDLSSTDSIQAVLDSWAPVAETTVRSMSRAASENLVRFHRDRMSAMSSDEWSGGKVTVMGSPVQMASNDQYSTVMSDVGHLQASNGETVRTTGNIPDDMAVYLSGSFIDGDSAAMPTGQNLDDEDFDGWSVSGGVEKRLSEKASVGGSLSYTQLEAAASLGQVAETDYFAGTLYGQLRAENNFILDGQVSLGTFNSQTERTVTSFPGAATLSSDDDSTILSADLRVSKAFETGNAVFTPRVSLQNTLINFDTVDEVGGAPALSINRKNIHSTQGRVGFGLSTAKDAKFDLSAHGDFVKEFGSISDTFDASFAGVNGSTGEFALFGTDTDWAEIGVGLGFDVQNAKINISADTTIGRKDFETRVYRAGVTYKF